MKLLNFDISIYVSDAKFSPFDNALVSAETLNRTHSFVENSQALKGVSVSKNRKIKKRQFNENQHNESIERSIIEEKVEQITICNWS